MREIFERFCCKHPKNINPTMRKAYSFSNSNRASSIALLFSLLLFNACINMGYAQSFFGGISDGHANSQVVNNICPPFTNIPIPFLGGISDGHANSQVVNDPSCAPVILPIELINFTSACRSNAVYVNWQTASETNNDYFTIERSTDAINWQNIAQINGAGNSSTLLSYEFIDSSPISIEDKQGVRYYRLKQTDYDGQHSYSEIVAVAACDANKQLCNISVYPNASADGLFHVKLTEPAPDFTIRVFNMYGTLLYNQNYKNVNANDVLNLPLQTFANGMYLLETVTETNALPCSQTKIVIQK